MNVHARVALLLICFGCLPQAYAQNIEVNPQNRTVAVSLSDMLQVDPEVAVVTIGYDNFGPTREAAFSKNTEVSKKIADALLAAGIKPADIETNTVTLGRVDDSDKSWTTDEKKERQYEVDQQWNVRVPPAQAQNVVDVAVAAGSNELTGVNWTVSDPSALDAKANITALDKARALAEQMAGKFGAKVGQLLYVGNTQQADSQALNGHGFGNNLLMTVNVEAPPPPPALKLFPQKVRRDVNIYVVFALQ
jgi:uncharacterized protein